MNKADFLVREIKIEILNGMMWMLKLQMDPKFKVKTFRFKFDEDFQTKLNGFAKLNRYADRHEFKEAWEKWCEANRGYIDDEEGRLKREGYDGDVINKMYTSVQRCKYVSINSDVIEKMDEHVAITVREPNFKPASAFKDFCEVNKNLLTNEVGRLYNKERLPTNEIKYKFKKAYKNRYFQMVKQI
jgi:hypothetical protein